MFSDVFYYVYIARFLDTDIQSDLIVSSEVCWFVKLKINFLNLNKHV